MYETQHRSHYLIKSRESSEEKIQFATAAQSTICVRIILSTSTAIIYNTVKASHTCMYAKNNTIIKVKGAIKLILVAMELISLYLGLEIYSVLCLALVL